MNHFKKNERLGNFRLKTLLFSQGKGFYSHPFRVVYLQVTPLRVLSLFPAQRGVPISGRFCHPAKCLVTVSRKKYKRAVDRNRIKRLMREGYRNNKSDFYAFLKSEGLNVLVAFIYTRPSLISFLEVEKGMKIALIKIQEHLRADSSRSHKKGTMDLTRS